MKEINKFSLFSAAAGASVAIIILFFNILMIPLDDTTSATKNLNSDVAISFANISRAPNSLAVYLSLFDFNIDDLNNTNQEILSNLENVSIRIVAQAYIGEVQNTLLEIISPSETKRIVVTEGETVNGFLIKSINSKQLVVEKNAEEYIIKLFHPKELNLTKNE